MAFFFFGLVFLDPMEKLSFLFSDMASDSFEKEIVADSQCFEYPLAFFLSHSASRLCSLDDTVLTPFPRTNPPTYISPSDTIMSPCTAKLSAYKSKHFLKCVYT